MVPAGACEKNSDSEYQGGHLRAFKRSPGGFRQRDFASQSFEQRWNSQQYAHVYRTETG